MYVFTSHSGSLPTADRLWQFRIFARFIAPLIAHFSVDSLDGGIHIVTYQIHELISLTPFWVVLLYVGTT